MRERGREGGREGGRTDEREGGGEGGRGGGREGREGGRERCLATLTERGCSATTLRKSSRSVSRAFAASSNENPSSSSLKWVSRMKWCLMISCLEKPFISLFCVCVHACVRACV